MTEAGALRLLLVDDDVAERDAVRRALEAAGIDTAIEEAESAAAAVARLRAGRFDCAVVDDELADGDGMQILRHVREAGVATPVIVLTGDGDDQAAVGLMKAGAADCLSRSALSAERLGLADTGIRRSHTLPDQRVHAREQLGVIALPVQIVFPGLLMKDELHSKSSRSSPPPSSSSRTALSRRSALRGLATRWRVSS